MEVAQRVIGMKELSKDAWVEDFETSVAAPLKWGKEIMSALQPIYETPKTEGFVPSAGMHATIVKHIHAPRPAIVGQLLSKEELDFIEKGFGDSNLESALAQGNKHLQDKILPTITKLKVDYLSIKGLAIFRQPIQDTDNDDYIKALEKFAPIDVDSTDLETALVTALDLKDTALHGQVRWLRSTLRLAKAVVPISLIVARNPGKPKLHADLVPLVLFLRRMVHAAEDRMGSMKFGENDPLDPAPGPNHNVHELDLIDNGHDLMENYTKQANAALQFLVTSWTEDVQQWCAMLQDYCPKGWELYPDTLLEQEPIVQELLTNEHFAQIPPVLAELTNYKAHVKAIVADNLGLLLSAPVLTELNSLILSATNLVTNTYALYQVKVVLPKVQSLTARKSALEHLKKEIASKKHAKLCPAIAQELKKFENPVQS